jgi:hypothetical protein
MQTRTPTETDRAIKAVGVGLVLGLLLAMLARRRGA